MSKLKERKRLKEENALEWTGKINNIKLVLGKL